MNNRNCAFTIVAKNYIGLALILEQSIRQHYGEVDFYIVVADEFESGEILDLPSNVLVAKDIIDIKPETWDNMSFKYNLTEFCTSIKPATFKYFLITRGYEKVVYLDPDIYFFGSMGAIFDDLNTVSIILTPHILEIPQIGETDSPESDWMACGIFNLGFCAVRNTPYSVKIIEWWHSRLLDQCFNERLKCQFTDQKWMDFIPSILPPKELEISRKKGWNLAPWNFFERKVVDKEGSLFVTNRSAEGQIDPLLFVHFSGYDYEHLRDGLVSQHNISNLKEYSDLTPVFSIYSRAIRQNVKIFNKYINQHYSYAMFDNGVLITQWQRRLYSSLVEKGEIISAPFNKNGSFYTLLKKRHLVGNSIVDNSKTSKNNLHHINRKLRFINKASRLLCRVIGTNRYFLLIRLLRSYSMPESQVHLVDSKYDESNIF